MPTTYAHYKFGKDVFYRLPKKIRKEIIAYMPLYKIGLHGPDILFYYKPFKKNEISRQGTIMHHESAKNFFEASKKINLEREEEVGGRAYLYGFICHFALDTICHGYINEQVRKSGISHAEIESEFDRSLMLRDGYNPISHRPTKHILPSEENARVIAAYFKELTTPQIKKTLVSMQKYLNILCAPNRLKRYLIYGGLKVTGNFQEMKGLIINYKANPRCIKSCMTLSRLYSEAIILAAKLIIEYESYLRNAGSLSKDYERNYEGEEVIMTK